MVASPKLSGNLEFIKELIQEINNIYKQVHQATGDFKNKNITSKLEVQTKLRLQARSKLYLLHQMEAAKLLGYHKNQDFCQNELPISRTTYNIEVTFAYFEDLVFNLPVGTIYQNWFIYSGCYKYFKIRRTKSHNWYLDYQKIEQAKQAWAIARDLDNVGLFPRIEVMADAIGIVLEKKISVVKKKYFSKKDNKQIEQMQEEISRLSIKLEQSTTDTQQLICKNIEISEQLNQAKAENKRLHKTILKMRDYRATKKLNRSLLKKNHNLITANKELRTQNKEINKQLQNLQKTLNFSDSDSTVEVKAYLVSLRECKILINEASLSAIQESKACDILIFHGPTKCKAYIQYVLSNRNRHL